MSEVARMSVAEFRKLGLLHELNRKFLHRIGLALEVKINKDGSEEFGEVWDWRDDPEGGFFDDVDEEHVSRVAEMVESKMRVRLQTGICDREGIQVKPYSDKNKES